MIRRRLLQIALAGPVFLFGCGLALPKSSPESGSPILISNANGESIYLTGVNLEGLTIRYSGGSAQPMMMASRLSCASCHGSDGRGGQHVMHMQAMDAPDIRPGAMESEHDAEPPRDGEHANGSSESYSLDLFRQAVVDGRHPDGTALDQDMPRWELTEKDLADLFEFIESLP